MNNSDKSKKQLLKEIELLSTKIGKLEKSEIDHELAGIALQESEEKYKVLYESSQDAIMMLAPPTWLFTAGNQATIKMFHAKNEKEFISKEPWELSPEYQPDGQLSSEKAKKMIQKAMKTGSNFFEWTHNRIKGEDFPATVLLTRIELKDKQLLQATVRDITKRKTIEDKLNKHHQQLEKLVDERTKELKEEKEYYHSFVTSLNDWVWEMDLKGIHTYSNPAVESVLGYKVDEVVGYNVTKLWLDIDKQKKSLKILKSALSAGKGWKNVVGRFQHKNGSLVITESSATPLYNSENKLVGYRGLDHDVTERKKAEEEIMLGRERLTMLNKIIRHDLSNDFIVIRSAVNIFRKTPDPEMIDEIENRVVKSLKTINNYRKYEAFISSNADLNEIEISEKIKNRIIDFPKIKINVEGECRVFADEAIEPVFANLISNSIKHGKASQIDIKISSEDNLCEIRFMDNGMGIPVEIKDKIFDEGFFHGKSGHTGIGLHIVKKTIERYGGHIYVEDNKPKGAVFVISLRKVLNITKGKRK